MSSFDDSGKAIELLNMNVFDTGNLMGVMDGNHVLFSGDSVTIERVVNNSYQAVRRDFMRLTVDQWQVVLRGSMTMTVFEDCRTLSEGDSIYLPRGSRIRLDSTSGNPPCMRLIVHFKASDNTLRR